MFGPLEQVPTPVLEGLARLVDLVYRQKNLQVNVPDGLAEGSKVGKDCLVLPCVSVGQGGVDGQEWKLHFVLVFVQEVMSVTKLTCFI